MKLKGKVIVAAVVMCLVVGGGVSAIASVKAGWVDTLGTIESNFNEVVGLLNGEKKIVEAKEAEIEDLNS